MASSAPPARRSRRGEKLQPLALKYFTRGALLDALEARGWRQFPASGVHTWVFYTPEGLERRANKEQTALNVDYVLDDDGLYAYVELHGILDELVREKEAAEAAEAEASKAAESPGKGEVEASTGSPLWLNPSPSPPLHPVDGPAAASASSAQSMRSAASELDDQSFIPTSDDEEQVHDERQANSRPTTPSRKRPRLRTSRSTGGKQPRQRRSSSSAPRASAAAARRSSSSQRRSMPSRSSSDPDIHGDDDGDGDEKMASIGREYAQSRRELRELELELEALEQRVKKKRFHVRKLKIERDCHWERQRKLRELKEQFYGGDVKKEPGIGECD